MSLSDVELLREVLRYLERDGDGIYCRRDEQGNLHGPETRRFELAEKVRRALAESAE